MNEYNETYFKEYGSDKTPYEYNGYYALHAWILHDFLEGVKTVLDVGCATGLYVKGWSLATLVRIEGIDISEWAVNNPCDVLIKNKLKVGDMLKLPYPNNSFDLVQCFDVLEHLDEKDIPQAIKELRRVSKRYIIMTTLFKGIDEHEMKFKQDATHKTLKSRAWWMKQLGCIDRGYVMKPYDCTTPAGLTEFPLVNQMIITTK